MKIIDCEQNSLEWLTARAGLVTASEIDALVSPTFEIRKGAGVQTYLAQKVAEKWLSGPIPGHMDLTMEIGHILENEAIPAYEFDYNQKIQRVGLVTDDFDRYGCSPDGLIDKDGGIEIKCPEPKSHVKYLLENKLPNDYMTQVHFSLFVTGRRWWKFMSYRRGFPTFIITVERDEEKMQVFQTALNAFLPKLDSELNRLIALNGGERPAKNTFREALMREEQPQDEMYGRH